MTQTRHLILTLGDQLDAAGPVFDDFVTDSDAVLMLEVAEEARYIRQHKQRLVLFFSAMRHFRAALEDCRRRVHYVRLDDPANTGAISTELERHVQALHPQRIIVTEPGDHRVSEAIRRVAGGAGIPLEVRPDRHFLCSSEEFQEHAQGRRQLLMENFYRQMRRRHGVLMDGKIPVGGRWNFDAENRESLRRGKRPEIPAPRKFRPDAITREVMAMVEKEFADSPGSAERFDYPLTPAQARAALGDFIDNRLGQFGRYQDAMAIGEPYLFHSRLSSALNLHLLDPREAIEAAVAAGQKGHAPLNAVEGFVRQIIGWREFVRGVYWWKMPGYAELNCLAADLPMPAFMWTADTEMACVRHSVGQLIEHAYAHHIQRLMVLGLFALLAGVDPQAVHRWHMSMYIDAVDWVSLPNVIGMSQHADGGIVGSKPYCASGNYIDRMSDYCRNCRFDPKKSEGEDACPFTTLYWDFLRRNKARFAKNRRMGFQLKNLDRKTRGELRAITKTADRLKVELTRETYDP